MLCPFIHVLWASFVGSKTAVFYETAGGALEELQRVIGLIRQKWQDTHIIIRGDSAYSREDIMRWCEEQIGVDYVARYVN